MRSNMIEFNLPEAVEELSAMEPALSSSIGRFARDLEAENRRNQGQPRTGRPSTRLPGPPVGRVVAHRVAFPKRLRTRIPATVVQQKTPETRRKGSPLPPAQAIQEAAKRLRDALRNRLLALHNALANAQRRLQAGTRVVQPDFRLAPRQPPIGSSEHPLVSLLAIVAAVATGLIAVTSGAGSLPRSLSPVSGDRVGILAQAIATTEGYYAPGERDGYSLPHWLNNPGSLKKPALGAESLPTWGDTGLIVFPNERMGWDALNHQVELMVSGKSSVYSPSDSILDVATKYADGDLNWGRRIARQLGISPSCTLGEIAGARPNCSL